MRNLVLEKLGKIWDVYVAGVRSCHPDDFKDYESLEEYGLHQWRVNTCNGCNDFGFDEFEKETNRELATFSVKMDETVIKKWRTYTSIDKYGETGRLTEKAIKEYMTNHPLEAKNYAKFETLMRI